VPKQNLFADEQRMKLLRDAALFSDSEHARFQSVRALARFGKDAVPYLAEVADSASSFGFKKYCTDALDRIERTQRPSLSVPVTPAWHSPAE
jgi:hypothetical protein